MKSTSHYIVARHALHHNDAIEVRAPSFSVYDTASVRFSPLLDSTSPVCRLSLRSHGKISLKYERTRVPAAHSSTMYSPAFGLSGAAAARVAVGCYHRGSHPGGVLRLAVTLGPRTLRRAVDQHLPGPRWNSVFVRNEI